MLVLNRSDHSLIYNKIQEAKWESAPKMEQNNLKPVIPVHLCKKDCPKEAASQGCPPGL